ncbi:MAG: hypothetical protein WCQ95_08065 [Bacteroidota bacterium]
MKDKRRFIPFKERFKLIYLLFLIIPFVYCLLWNLTKEAQPVKTKLKYRDYFYFSARTSQPATINLSGSKDSLISWQVNSAGYKDLEFLGELNDSAGIGLKVHNLNKQDTIFFLGFNLYRNNRVVSLYEQYEKNCYATNAVLTEKNGNLIAVVKQSGLPVCINLNPTTKWKTTDSSTPCNLYLVLVFVLAFILIIVLAPPVKYFCISFVISLLFLLVGFEHNTNFVGRVTFWGQTSVKNFQVFYNQTPIFLPANKFSSNEIANSFGIPINFKTNGFMRCDVGDGPGECKGLQIKSKLGLFSMTDNLETIEQGKLVLNDLVLQGNTYYSTGNDPYIKFTSSYFVKQIWWLLFLNQNMFLFICILVLIVLLSLHRFVGGLNKVKLKWSYAAFLLLPLTYFLLTHSWKNKAAYQSDQIYFSAQISKPATIVLFNGNDSVTSWKVDSRAYKYLQYADYLNENAGFRFKMKGLAAKDTISLFSVNLYHHNQVYALPSRDKWVRNVTNIRFLNNGGEFDGVVQQSGEDVLVNLLPVSIQEKDPNNFKLALIIVLLLFLTVVIIIAIAPKTSYLIISSLVASLLMFLFFWIGSDIQDQVSIKASSQIKSADFYYNDRPVFVPDKVKIVDSVMCFFRSNVDLAKNNYLRCDVGEKTTVLNDLRICVKTGVLQKEWNYNTISTDNILMNDLIKRNGTYTICGNDPYFILTTSSQMQSIEWVLTLRQNIFFFIAVFFFFVFLFIGKKAEKENLTVFFFNLLFLVIISGGLLFHVFNSGRLILSSEKRFANPAPTFQLDSAAVFTQKLESFIKDQVPGRNNIIIMRNLIEYSILKQIAANPNVYFGKDGWMFYIGDSCREMYENRHPLTEQKLKMMRDVMVARRDWLRERGIHFYIIFPPQAYFVYEEKVGPRLYRHNKKSKIDQLLEYLKHNSDLDVIDIYHPIMEAKSKSHLSLYYKNDSHWNCYGGYIAYRTMIDYMKKDFPNIGEALIAKEKDWIEFDNNEADLLKLLAIDPYYTRHEYFPIIKNNITPKDTTYPTYPEYKATYRALTMNNYQVDKPSLLMYRDSFGNYLISYLNNNFNRCTYLWTPLFYPTIIEKEKPDIVIQEMADPTIYNLLLANPELPKMKDSTGP